MYYYQVAPTKIVRDGVDSLTYSSDSRLPIGVIVDIPVGKSNLLGVIITETTKPTYPTKKISSVIVNDSLPHPLLQAAIWLAKYYATPLATVLQTVLPSGLRKKRRPPKVQSLTHHRDRTNYVFNELQDAAIEQIKTSPAATILLHGVTGSGKTRVYIESALDCIASGRSVIVLVPEIALTAQLIAEFQNSFSNVIVTHSRQTEAERHLVWLRALTSTTPLVAIGPRSALFLPLKSVGMIVVDECHEPSYKQEQSPRYSALTLAKVLASNHQAKLILGSATPAVQDHYLAQSTGSTIISLPYPAVHDAKQPQISVIDMTKRQNFHKHRFFSDKMLEAIDNSLSQGKQALIFHNRRGSASITLCQNCGWQAGCPRCFIPLTLHTDKAKLICHICNFSTNIPTSCPECGSIDIIHKGIGTKLIESELRRLYPSKTIMRFDGDNTPDATVDSNYTRLYRGEIDIIIGTQVVAKGLDLPHLQTVCVVQADAGLSLPDYTAAERTFQLLYQVIGRVGRNKEDTTVIIQSYQPDHPAVTDGISRNYQDFYERTIKLRRRAGFPPFSFLLKLVCTYKTEATAIRNAKQLSQTLAKLDPTLHILGPTPAFYERVRDTYRWQIVIASDRRAKLTNILDELPKKNWQFELDPISLL